MANRHCCRCTRLVPHGVSQNHRWCAVVPWPSTCAFSVSWWSVWLAVAIINNQSSEPLPFHVDAYFSKIFQDGYNDPFSFSLELSGRMHLFARQEKPCEALRVLCSGMDVEQKDVANMNSIRWTSLVVEILPHRSAVVSHFIFDGPPDQFSAVNLLLNFQVPLISFQSWQMAVGRG